MSGVITANARTSSFHSVRSTPSVWLDSEQGTSNRICALPPLSAAMRFGHLSAVNVLPKRP